MKVSCDTSLIHTKAMKGYYNIPYYLICVLGLSLTSRKNTIIFNIIIFLLVDKRSYWLRQIQYSREKCVIQVMSSSFALKRIGIFHSSSPSSLGGRKSWPLNAGLISQNSRQSARKLCLFYGEVRKSTDLSGQFSLPQCSCCYPYRWGSLLWSFTFLKLSQLGKQECRAEPCSKEGPLMYSICKHVK